MIHQLIEANRYFNAELGNYFETISEGDWRAIAMLLAFSFAYGVVHALGPGHGKALLSGYLLAHPKLQTSHIFRIGFFIALVHALSALVLSLGATYIIHISATKLLRDVTLPMTQISGGLIVIMGCWILFEVFRSRTQEEKVDTKKELSVIILSGIVPCPGVMTLSFFAMSLGELSIGIFAALCMSLGMGLTISLVGFVTSRLNHISAIQTQPLWFWLLRLIGAVLVIGIGIVLVGFTSAKPF
ncbi:MAG: high frequency lysogenization protein HflD [Sulfurospirillum sp.]|nr:high frequency lysogenization protein HflD [Sulfurospirillum sp.]